MTIHIIKKSESRFHVEGFPNAVKVIEIIHPQRKELAGLALHKADLEFAQNCLKAINTTNETIIRQALWQAAIMNFMKCFGFSVSRERLDFKIVFEKEEDLASKVFKYFKNLRDKHLVHDENAYAQSIPGAILNKENQKFKIEEVVCFDAIGETLNNTELLNLNLLIKKTMIYVCDRFDKLRKTIKDQMEMEPYDELNKRKEIVIKMPTVEDISRNRLG